MDSIKSTNTRGFWDTVATQYSTNTMTTHSADFEMDTIFQNLGNNTYNGIASFGTADGNRDPIKIFEYLKSKNLVGKQFEFFLNDISSQMIAVAKTNMANKNLDTYVSHYMDGEMCNISNIDFVTTVRNPIFCIGVYNAKYITESLELYKENKNTIGENFILTPIHFGTNVDLEEAESIQFNINDHFKHEDQILKMMDNAKFYAYRVKTEKNFISHFFLETPLKKVLQSAFENMNIVQYHGTKGDGYDNGAYQPEKSQKESRFNSFIEHEFS